ncbi:hypothetical protein SKAU_G00282050 [Synaphobranchus kaupii]|uniref:DDE Tnp4 domain-containing protein n=1 Tax=Synaphobranchus kaupii TaxID=118154 RepID=A0A9Q1EX84_SYNKA|nr:hypothetical protein SKAU_G00282050 [Synaphobranchus kaupii]
MLPNKRDHGWGYTLEVLVFVYWLASGTSYRVVSQVFAVPRSTIHRMVHAIADDLMAILPRVICFPEQDDLEATGEGFCRLAGHSAFRKAVGASDECHVRIRPPGGVTRQCYVNRKLFPSLTLQAVCDSSGKFLDVFVGYPGSVHDVRMLRNSPIYCQPPYPPRGYALLGDGGVPMPGGSHSNNHPLQGACPGASGGTL